MLFLPSGLCGVSFPSLGINTHCWRLFCFVSAPPSRLYCGFRFRTEIPGATAGDSAGECGRPIAGPLPLRVNPSACLFIFGCFIYCFAFLSVVHCILRVPLFSCIWILAGLSWIFFGGLGDTEVKGPIHKRRVIHRKLRIEWSHGCL